MNKILREGIRVSFYAIKINLLKVEPLKLYFYIILNYIFSNAFSIELNKVNNSLSIIAV